MAANKTQKKSQLSQESGNQSSKRVNNLRGNGQLFQYG